MQGGNFLLLYFDDWEYFDEFFCDLLVCCLMCWVVLLSKNVSKDVFYLVFDVDLLGCLVMCYIDQFVQLKDFEEGIWLSCFFDVLEISKNIFFILVLVGKFLFINNLFWLYGCDCFMLYLDLCCELMCQCGYFVYFMNYYQIY